MLIENPTIGSDVEFFVKDNNTNDIITAEGLIEGSKYDPHFFVPNNKYYAMQLDNVLAEGNIPPAESSDQFVEYLTFLKSSIEQKIGSDYSLVAAPSFDLSPKYLASEQAKTFGCDPSLNCWSLDEISIAPPVDTTTRSAGFHIHVGYKDLSEETNIALARAMDLFLGVPAAKIEPSNKRFALGYATAGNFRHQPHGVEYRTLSAFFAGKESYIKWAFEQTQRAIVFVNEHPDAKFLEAKTLATAYGALASNIIQYAINNRNLNYINILIKEFDLVVPS